MENEKAKLKILRRGDMSFVNIENVDIESEGIMNMSDTNFNNAGYVNKKGGVTNIEGEFNSSNALIKNEGIFNIRKTGKISIVGIDKFKKEHPVLVFLGIVVSMLTIIKLFMEIIKL